jgi:carbamoyl-phosphate synthase small subunit
MGNYGVPDASFFESDSPKIAGLVVSSECADHSHWNAVFSLGEWLKKSGVPAISGIDTRAVTKILREEGTMLGEIGRSSSSAKPFDPGRASLVADVSCRDVSEHGRGKKKVLLVDCGCKRSILTALVEREVRVVRVPWDHNFLDMEFDGILISNGPGDPKACAITIDNIKKAMMLKKPMFGICLGNQLMALAAGADTYKLKYGHRSQNQPCIEAGGSRCYITSQNHGYAVKEGTLPSGWRPWFKNLNDLTNEGIRHESLPFMSVQFHPEACPGPTDTKFLFDEFVKML